MTIKRNKPKPEPEVKKIERSVNPEIDQKINQWISQNSEAYKGMVERIKNDPDYAARQHVLGIVKKQEQELKMVQRVQGILNRPENLDMKTQVERATQNLKNPDFKHKVQAKMGLQLMEFKKISQTQQQAPKMSV